MHSRYSRTVATISISIALLLVSFGDLGIRENQASASDREPCTEGAGCSRSDVRDCPPAFDPESRIAQRSDYVVYANPLPSDEIPLERIPARPPIVRAATGSILTFSLVTLPDPGTLLEPNDEIEFIRKPTATSSDDSVFRVTEVRDRLLTIEILTAGDATLDIEWDGAKGSRSIEAIQPQQYDVIFDEMQFLRTPSETCARTNEELKGSRQIYGDFVIQPGVELIFTVSAEGPDGPLFGNAQVPLLMEEFTGLGGQQTSFSEAVTSESDGRFIYQVPDGAVGQLLRVSSSIGSTRTTPLFEIVPANVQLDILALGGVGNLCMSEDTGVELCRYDNSDAKETGDYGVLNLLKYDRRCLDVPSECSVSVQLSVTPGPDFNSGVATVTDSCLPDGVATCGSSRPCDFLLSPAYGLDIDDGLTVFMRATFGGTTRTLQFEPVPAQ